MEVQEISSRLDYALQKAKGGLIIDEYQKSLYLTKAQTLFVESALANYEYGDILRHILGQMLVTQETSTFTDEGTDMYGLVPDTNIKAVVYEEINDSHMTTIPLDYNDIHDSRLNPFRKPYKKLAYRITGNDKFTIFSSENVTKYKYIYCEEPNAIVLEPIPSHLAIQGVFTEQTSVLPYDSILKVIDLAVIEILKDMQRLAPPQKEEKKQ